MFLAFHGCWLACDTWTAFRYVLYKHAFQNMSWKGGSMEVAEKRYDDNLKLWHLVQVVLLSFFHVNEASRYVMMPMHQQHINEATA